MKKFKRIIATALTAMMMLAMSVTSFAAETTSIKVTNLSDSEATEVSIYLIAEINQDSWKFADWAEGTYSENANSKEYTFDYEAMKNVITAENSKASAEQTKTVAAGETTVEFTGVKAGAYFVLAKGDKTTYQAMVAKTYDYNEKDVFVAKSATVVAKSDSTTVVKKTDDTFVSADELVTFTVETEVPFIAEQATDKTFVVYDQPENLKDMTLVKVTVGGQEVEATLGAMDAQGIHAIDLTKYATNENVGKKVVVTLTAIVDGANGYVNTAWTNRNTEITEYNVVRGFTASITVKKVDATTGNPLSGAKFTFKKDGAENNLKFIKKAEGVYEVSTDANAFDEVEVAADATLKLQGLEEGVYHVTETQAPEGYAINDDIQDIVITPNYKETTRLDVPEAYEHINLSGEACQIKDSKLSKLPFTGGMGTTIFTVLGVAIMVLAAALFFAVTRKNAAK